MSKLKVLTVHLHDCTYYFTMDVQLFAAWHWYLLSYIYLKFICCFLLFLSIPFCVCIFAIIWY